MEFHEPLFIHQCSISVVQDWLTALKDGIETYVILLDVQKMFDSVPNAPLLHKQADIRINPTCLDGFRTT